MNREAGGKMHLHPNDELLVEDPQRFWMDMYQTVLGISLNIPPIPKTYCADRVRTGQTIPVWIPCLPDNKILQAHGFQSHGMCNEPGFESIALEEKWIECERLRIQGQIGQRTCLVGHKSVSGLSAEQIQSKVIPETAHRLGLSVTSLRLPTFEEWRWMAVCLSLIGRRYSSEYFPRIGVMKCPEFVRNLWRIEKSPLPFATAVSFIFPADRASGWFDTYSIAPTHNDLKVEYRLVIDL